MASKREVESFLAEFRRRCPESTHLIVEDRRKNQAGLIALGLTKLQRHEVIVSLTPEDYSAGPKRDREGSGFVWEFGKLVEGQEVYIKLKLFGAIPICLSFHPAEYPVTYPFKRKRESREKAK